MSRHTKILEAFQQRLTAAISRSPLLRVRISKRGRLLDCSQLEMVSPDLPRQLLADIIAEKKPRSINLKLVSDAPRQAAGDESAEAALCPLDEDTGEIDPLVRKHQELYDLLDRRMRRYAELAKRETGVHALWLGYPLLHVSLDNDCDKGILAPVFLWPVAVNLNFRREGCILIGRDKDAGPAQFNMAMANWINRQFQLNLPAPDEDELQDLDWDKLKAALQTISQAFQHPPSIDCEADLQSIPDARHLRKLTGTHFYNAAVLGYIRWQNEAILADLDAMKDLESCDGVVSAFVAAADLPKPEDQPPPPEADRFLVCDADFSQERVIWQGRVEPGLVVHGPPGTGKSQTIVNLIADALAHGRRILMVCQKQAATRVVMERLRAAGLADLCLEVHDAETDRLAVFNTIRKQTAQMPREVPPEATKQQKERNNLAQQIETLENELDSYAQALHQTHPKFGLSYRQMKAREGKVYTEFSTVRSTSVSLAFACASGFNSRWIRGYWKWKRQWIA